MCHLVKFRMASGGNRIHPDQLRVEKADFFPRMTRKLHAPDRVSFYETREEAEKAPFNAWYESHALNGDIRRRR